MADGRTPRELDDSPDDTVGTLSDLFRHSVALVDNKVLIKDLEDLASLEVAHGGELRGAQRRGRARKKSEECGAQRLAQVCAGATGDGGDGALSGQEAIGELTTLEKQRGILRNTGPELWSELERWR